MPASHERDSLRKILDVAFDWLHSEDDVQAWDALNRIHGIAHEELVRPAVPGTGDHGVREALGRILTCRNGSGEMTTAMKSARTVLAAADGPKATAGARNDCPKCGAGNLYVTCSNAVCDYQIAAPAPAGVGDYEREMPLASDAAHDRLPEIEAVLARFKARPRTLDRVVTISEADDEMLAVADGHVSWLVWELARLRTIVDRRR